MTFKLFKNFVSVSSSVVIKTCCALSLGAISLLMSCQTGGPHSADRATELQRVEVLSQLLQPSRKPAARYKPGFEMRVTSPINTGNWAKLEVANHTLFIDSEPVLSPQDIVTISLRQQNWSGLGQDTRKRFESMSGIIETDHTLYSVELRLTTLGTKIYQDIQQRFSDGFLVLRDDDKKVRLFGFVDANNQDHHPILYFTSEKSAAEATRSLDSFRAALEHSFDL